MISPSTRPSPLLLIVFIAISAIACSSTAMADAPHGAVRSGGSRRFLASVVGGGGAGGACNPEIPRACSGGRPVPGRPIQLLKCCGRACVDVLDSWAHCGACGARCPFGTVYICCGGRCVDVARDPENCGVCGRTCAAGLQCAFAMCGYA